MGTKPPEARQSAAVKCFSTQVCCRVRPPAISPNGGPPKISSDLRESRDPTRPGQGGHVPTRCYATAVSFQNALKHMS